MYLTFLNSCVATLPEVFLVVSINIILFYSAVYNTSSYYDYPILIKNVSLLSFQILLFALFLNVNNTLYSVTIFANLFVVDLLGILVKSFVLLSSTCVLLMSLSFNQSELFNNVEFPIFVLLTVLGISSLISSYDFLIVYVAVELQSFCSYILASLKRNSEFSAEAGLKYFVLGAFSSGFLLFGCSLIYGFTGTTNYKLLSILILNGNSFDNNGVLIGSFFILVSLLFKLSAAPFHLWSPDVYEGAPMIVTAFFSIIYKLGFLVFFLRLFFDSLYELCNYWQILLVITSLLSMFIGSFAAIWQIKLKRLLAFSTIGHIGYMLICFSCNSFESVYALIFYSIIYVFMNISCFSILLALRKNSSQKKLKYNEDLSNITKTNPFVGVCVITTFFSIAGVPPLAGFFSKMFVFLSSISQYMYCLTIIGVLMSIVSCFYYLRVLQLSYFEQFNKWITLKKVSKEIAFLISLANLILISFFIHLEFFTKLIHYSIFDLYL